MMIDRRPDQAWTRTWSKMLIFLVALMIMTATRSFLEVLFHIE